MPKYYCDAPQCRSSVVKKGKPEKYPEMRNVTFHAFPTKKKNKVLRQKWIQMVRREPEWQPNELSRICSLHFVGSNGPTAANPVPTLFHYNGFKKTPPHKRRSTSTSTKRELNVWTGDKSDTFPQEEMSIYECVPSHQLEVCISTSKGKRNLFSTASKLAKLPDYFTPPPKEHRYCFFNASNEREDAKVFKDCATQTELSMLDSADLDSNNKTSYGNFKCTKVQERDIFISKVMKDDCSVRSYTGFPSKDWILQVFEIIQSSVPAIKYWSGQQSVKQKNYQSQKRKKCGPTREMPIFFEFLFTMIRLRTGILLWVLSDLFSLSQSQASKIFSTWINLLFNIFKPLIIFPTRHQIDLHMPESFKKSYPRTRIIIDCTEFFFQRPRSTVAQALTWSSYKSRNTGKVLIGITPSGLVSVISRVYTGNASDRYITKSCGLLDLIEENDDIMADRGFTVRDLLILKKATLNIPPFTRKSSKGAKALTQNEIKHTRKITSVRIHVERAIQRIENFKLLAGTIPLKLKDKLYQMIVIASFICNLHPKLVTK